MTLTDDDIKDAMNRLRQANKTKTYILVNRSALKFACHENDLVDRGKSYAPGLSETEGILLYDSDAKQYLGYLVSHESGDQPSVLLPCTNGSKYDMSSTCTITGYVSQR